jgi:hypothetical protein
MAEITRKCWPCWQLEDLHETVDDLKAKNLYRDTRLKLDLTGQKPRRGRDRHRL